MLIVSAAYKAQIEAIAEDPEVHPVEQAGCWGSELLTFASDMATLLTFAQTLFSAIFAEDLGSPSLVALASTEYTIQNNMAGDSVVVNLTGQDFNLTDLGLGNSVVVDISPGGTQITQL